MEKKLCQLAEEIKTSPSLRKNARCRWITITVFTNLVTAFFCWQIHDWHQPTEPKQHTLTHDQQKIAQ
ncbi:MAG: hypothetical protein HQL72_02225 [Magnetococcales bacterium]|nr:hypothetical protein [Magnetococcales bacterium]